MNFKQIHSLTLCCLVASIFLISTGCDPKPDKPKRSTKNTVNTGEDRGPKRKTPPTDTPASQKPRQLTPEEMWTAYIEIEAILGRTVLSVSESEKWIEENRSKIKIPDTLNFMAQHLITEHPFLRQETIITVDHNGKYRVVARGFTYQDETLRGFLNEQESKDWLESHGYQLVKIADGYTIKKERPGLYINKSDIYQNRPDPNNDRHSDGIAK